MLDISAQAIIFLLLAVLVLLLLAINIFLIVRFYKTSQRIDHLLQKGKIKDLKDVLLLQKEKNKDLEEKIEDAFSKISKLEGISKISIQKTGVVRFNPFNDLGGNQSFVIALLDKKNNGFLISSIFVKEGSRVYAKAVKDGKSDHALSKEEQEAINRAIA